MRFFILILIVSLTSLSLVGCGGSSTKSAEPEKGSLLRTFSLVDDQGRVSGTLTLNPQGGAELRDIDGKVIGSFSSQQDVQTPAEKPVEEATADKDQEVMEEDEQEK
jgi:hypothetical protein